MRKRSVDEDEIWVAEYVVTNNEETNNMKYWIIYRGKQCQNGLNFDLLLEKVISLEKSAIEAVISTGPCFVNKSVTTVKRDPLIIGRSHRRKNYPGRHFVKAS